MLDLNITLVFQLVNFFIALFMLNILLIRPIRTIIKKRNGIMDDMAGEADSFETQAAERLAEYEAELARCRQDAGLTREGRPQPRHQPSSRISWATPRKAPAKFWPRPATPCGVRPKPRSANCAIR